MHARSQIAEENRQVRQAPIQTAQPDQDHVRQAQGLAACCNAIRQMSKGLSVRHRPRGNRYLLAMSPDLSLISHQ